MSSYCNATRTVMFCESVYNICVSCMRVGALTYHRMNSGFFFFFVQKFPFMHDAQVSNKFLRVLGVIDKDYIRCLHNPWKRSTQRQMTSCSRVMAPIFKGTEHRLLPLSRISGSRKPTCTILLQKGRRYCWASRAVEAVLALRLAAQRRARGPVGSRAEGRGRGRVLTSLCVSLPISHASIIERASRRSPALCAQARAD